MQPRGLRTPPRTPSRTHGRLAVNGNTGYGSQVCGISAGAKRRFGETERPTGTRERGHCGGFDDETRRRAAPPDRSPIVKARIPPGTPMPYTGRICAYRRAVAAAHRLRSEPAPHADAIHRVVRAQKGKRFLLANRLPRVPLLSFTEARHRGGRPASRALPPPSQTYVE